MTAVRTDRGRDKVWLPRASRWGADGVYGWRIVLSKLPRKAFYHVLLVTLRKCRLTDNLLTILTSWLSVQIRAIMWP